MSYSHVTSRCTCVPPQRDDQIVVLRARGRPHQQTIEETMLLDPSHSGEVALKKSTGALPTEGEK